MLSPEPQQNKPPDVFRYAVSRVVQRFVFLHNFKQTIRKRFSRRLTVALFHKFARPPFGGANQFMLALQKVLKQRHLRVLTNKVSSRVDAYLLQAVRFDTELAFKLADSSRATIVHRVDGPIWLIRNKDKELDDLCFDLNRQIANSTILQSNWSYQKIIELGYRPVRPVIIHNAVDPDVFHAHGRVPFDRNRKVRLISTSWSDNPRKGGPIYKWIEEHLDWDRFDYTFVGRASEPFTRIRQIAPVPSEELADILRQHDIYITASQNDPCSNALIEALACGLPSLYLNDGGHPELVGYGGLPFNSEEDILPQLDVLVAQYEIFQNLIAVSDLDSVAEKYLALLRDE
jgi:glycosyltransferase involved in cell wall biosynthesis